MRGGIGVIEIPSSKQFLSDSLPQRSFGEECCIVQGAFVFSEPSSIELAVRHLSRYCESY